VFNKCLYLIYFFINLRIVLSASVGALSSLLCRPVLLSLLISSRQPCGWLSTHLCACVCVWPFLWTRYVKNNFRDLCKIYSRYSLLITLEM